MRGIAGQQEGQAGHFRHDAVLHTTPQRNSLNPIGVASGVRRMSGPWLANDFVAKTVPGLATTVGWNG
jgi:hypothetical protein